MKYLLIALLASLPLSALAFDKVGTYTRYRMDETSNHSIKVVFKTTISTDDNCNQFALSGNMRPVKVPKGSRTLVQDFLADFVAVHTEMACDRAPQKHLVHLESEKFEIQPIAGEIYANILVPFGMTVEVVQ